jgi:redox-sensitive bicupin YhaK (pirin superfamily)|eukprot:COSAG01_NODE_6401_length_3687_cov_4.704013_6_plen_105_part_00
MGGQTADRGASGWALDGGRRGGGLVCSVIAGTYNGTAGAASTFTPVELWDITVATHGKDFEFTTKAGHNTLLFVRRGGIVLSDGSQLGGQQVCACFWGGLFLSE